MASINYGFNIGHFIKRQKKKKIMNIVLFVFLLLFFDNMEVLKVPRWNSPRWMEIQNYLYNQI